MGTPGHSRLWLARQTGMMPLHAPHGSGSPGETPQSGPVVLAWVGGTGSNGYAQAPPPPVDGEVLVDEESPVVDAESMGEVDPQPTSNVAMSSFFMSAASPSSGRLSSEFVENAKVEHVRRSAGLSDHDNVPPCAAA
ncbi:MAG: hypothetical protein QM820_30170 [Minicystis sp.]